MVYNYQTVCASMHGNIIDVEVIDNGHEHLKGPRTVKHVLYYCTSRLEVELVGLIQSNHPTHLSIA